MTSQDPFATLAALARRLRNDPRYMAYVLAVYQRQEELMDDELAQELGTLPPLVVRMAICKRPDSSSPQFAEQVRELADYTLTDAAQLAGVLRQVDAIETLASRPAPLSEVGSEKGTGRFSAGLLAAARDRYEPDDDSAEPQDGGSKPEE